MKDLILSILVYLALGVGLAVGIWLAVPDGSRGSFPWLLIIVVIAYVVALAKYGCTPPAEEH